MRASALSTERTEQRAVIRAFGLLIGGVTAVLIVTAAMVAAMGQEGWSVRFAAVMMTCLAALTGGALLGLIFGVPKNSRRTVTTPPTVAEPAGQDAASRLPYWGNSNLEEISDWLTKMIVGIALIKWNDIGAGIGQLHQAFRAASPDTSPAGQQLAGNVGVAAVLVSAGIGFLVAYLYARTFLPRLLAFAERAELDALSRDQQVRVEFGDVAATGHGVTSGQLAELFRGASPRAQDDAYRSLLDQLFTRVRQGQPTDPLLDAFEAVQTSPGSDQRPFVQANYGVALLNSSAGRQGTPLQQARDALLVWHAAWTQNLPALAGTPSELYAAHLAVARMLTGSPKRDPDVTALLVQARRHPDVQRWLSAQPEVRQWEAP